MRSYIVYTRFERNLDQLCVTLFTALGLAQFIAMPWLAHFTDGVAIIAFWSGLLSCIAGMLCAAGANHTGIKAGEASRW